MRFRLRVRDFGEHRFEFPSAALFGAPLEILRGHQGRQFLPDGRINELVDGHTLSLGEFLSVRGGETSSKTREVNLLHPLPLLFRMLALRHYTNILLSARGDHSKRKVPLG